MFDMIIVYLFLAVWGVLSIIVLRGGDISEEGLNNKNGGRRGHQAQKTGHANKGNK